MSTIHPSNNGASERNSANADDLTGAERAIAGRLGVMGEASVPSAVQSAHLTAMAEQPVRRAGWSKLRVGAAFLAGLLIGGTGLGVAGALPSPAQSVAHDVLGAVGINVPEGTIYVACSDDFENHGAFVSANAKAMNEARSGARDADEEFDSRGGNRAAANDDCGRTDGVGAGNADNPCKPAHAGEGKPPWAGPGTVEEKQAAKDAAIADRPAECDEDAEAAEGDEEG
ncbi:MAG TPA: hypothetical protein VGA13_02665 [Acidimicrobiales bacterium]|jgi:hypothetical protein